MSQQRLSRFSRVAEANRHAGEKRNQRSLKRILKQYRDVKLSPFPLANLRYYREGSLPIVGEDIVDVISFRKNPTRAGTNHEGDSCTRQNATESAQGRHCHYGVAYPIRASHDDSLNTFNLHLRHPI